MSEVFFCFFFPAKVFLRNTGATRRQKPRLNPTCLMGLFSKYCNKDLQLCSVERCLKTQRCKVIGNARPEVDPCPLVLVVNPSSIDFPSKHIKVRVSDSPRFKLMGSFQQ